MLQQSSNINTFPYIEIVVGGTNYRLTYQDQFERMYLSRSSKGGEWRNIDYMTLPLALQEVADSMATFPVTPSFVRTFQALPKSATRTHSGPSWHASRRSRFPEGQDPRLWVFR